VTALSLLTSEVSPDAGLDESGIRGLLSSLGLRGNLVSSVPIRRLSGGQLVRLELARLLWRRPLCLVLDEITTHLDYETVAGLRRALREWEGAVVLVSHDRWFVRGVVEGDRDDEGREEGEDEEGEEGEDDEEGVGRRRVVYRLAAGKLNLLDGGVREFEVVMERRVRRLMGD